MAVSKFIKENFALTVGIVLPVLLVILFFAASVIPKALATPPQYEAVFASSKYNHQPTDFSIAFKVKDGQLRANVARLKSPNYNVPQLFVFDAKSNNLREIAFDVPKSEGEFAVKEAESFTLDPSMKAPDGYEFESPSYRSGGIATEVFGGGHRGGYRLKKGTYGFKIPEKNGDNYYYNLEFIGWIVKKK